MQNRTPALVKRMEGRLFMEDGRLHYVLEVDTRAGFARVGYSADDRRQVVEMPISEVSRRLSAGSEGLESVNQAANGSRITRKSDGWFFRTRDGLKGPFASEDEAGEALDQYIESLQGA